MEPQKPKPPTLPQQSKLFLQKCPKAIKDFYYFHGVQLFGSMFPVELVEKLYKKLTKGIDDIGDNFEVLDNQQLGTFQVRAKKEISAQSNVFIVDHAVTFRYPDLRRLITENTNLIPRLDEMLKYHQELKQLPGTQKKEDKPIGVAQNFTQIEFDYMSLTQLSHLQFPNNTITLSLVGNQLTNEEELIKKLKYLNLKILWFNNNPLEQGQKILQYALNQTKVQVLNSKCTKHCTEWAIKYLQKMSINYAFNQNNSEVYRLNLDNRNVYNIDVTIFEKFPKLAVLSLKGHRITEQQQQKFIIHILENNLNLKELYLDYEAQTALYDLFTDKKLSKSAVQRILINGHSFFCKETTLLQNQIDEIQKNIFKLAGNYRLASSDQLDQSSVWYINDQVGSAIQHSDTPNVKMIPFLFAQDNKMGANMIAYSLFWPLKDIKVGQNIYRDYLNGITEERQRSSRLAIWYDLPNKFFNDRINQFDEKCVKLEKQTQKKIMQFYKTNTENQKQLIEKQQKSGELYPNELTLLTDDETILENLKHKQIRLVKNLEEAEIIWSSGALDEDKWIEVSDKFINQFPFEASVVMKHNLADTIQSALGNAQFLQRTYNLEKQLAEFIGDYRRKQNKGENNLWIIKPPNMARSLDMIITDNLSVIIKSMETGPKIAQKYIQQPVLRRGKKVDLRYILLVKSINPLTMFLYKHFWIRSSNNNYTIDKRYLSTYETQFTVMNYGDVSDFKQIPYKQFINEFQKDYAPKKWTQIDDKIKKMLRNTFIAAAEKYPKMHNEKSRAIYGIDVMIDETNMEPKLLEITFCPDCKRACQYFPTFFDEVFETLFLNINGQNMQRII